MESIIGYCHLLKKTSRNHREGDGTFMEFLMCFFVRPEGKTSCRRRIHPEGNFFSGQGKFYSVRENYILFGKRSSWQGRLQTVREESILEVQQ